MSRVDNAITQGEGGEKVGWRGRDNGDRQSREKIHSLRATSQTRSGRQGDVSILMRNHCILLLFICPPCKVVLVNPAHEIGLRGIDRVK